MVASSASITGPNVVLNTIVAEALDEAATRLEKAKDINKEAAAIVKEAINQHDKIIFNGNNYDPAWVKEAKKRGIPNISNTVDALAAMATPEAFKLFEKYKILSKHELHSRYEVYLEQYAKVINIEAQAAIDMVHKQYIPVVIQFTGALAETVGKLKAVQASSNVQKELLSKISGLLESASENVTALEAATKKAQSLGEAHAKAVAFRDKVVPAMNTLRVDIDTLETVVPKELWPVPSYVDMLFRL